LAGGSAGAVGRRPRTRYEISARGRRVLKAWIATPGNGPTVEFGRLLKVLFAGHGSKPDLLAAIDGARPELSQRVARTASVPHKYIVGRGGFPERLPWQILAGR
jgi:hypothetical protein